MHRIHVTHVDLDHLAVPPLIMSSQPTLI